MSIIATRYAASTVGCRLIELKSTPSSLPSSPRMVIQSVAGYLLLYRVLLGLRVLDTHRNQVSNYQHKQHDLAHFTRSK
ncbi:hypothetical protein BsWGS_09127 [Bradybaena similaris]